MKKIYEVNSQDEFQKLITKAVENGLQMFNNSTPNVTLLTTKELSKALKVSKVTIWSLEKQQMIPFIRIGNQKRYQLSSVLKKLSEINYSKTQSHGR